MKDVGKRTTNAGSKMKDVGKKTTNVGKKMKKDGFNMKLIEKMTIKKLWMCL